MAPAGAAEPMAKYQRIVLKLSGEVLAAGAPFGIDAARLTSLAAEVAEVAKTGIQIGLVVGGGNFFRGTNASAMNMDRVAADHMGMLATVINALALQDALEKQGIPTRVMTAIEIRQVAERPTLDELRTRLERRPGMIPSMEPAEAVRAERDRDHQ